MAYCTQSDIEKLIPTQELAELTTESGSTPDDVVVTEAIAKADAEIDAYCGVRYTVPFTTVPAIVESISVDMALYHLYSRRSIAPEARRIKYEDAIKFLKDISTGKATLGGSEAEAGSASQDVTEISSETRIFTRSEMGGW